MPRLRQLGLQPHQVQPRGAAFVEATLALQLLGLQRGDACVRHRLHVAQLQRLGVGRGDLEQQVLLGDAQPGGGGVAAVTGERLGGVEPAAGDQRQRQRQLDRRDVAVQRREAAGAPDRRDEGRIGGVEGLRGEIDARQPLRGGDLALGLLALQLELLRTQRRAGVERAPHRLVQAQGFGGAGPATEQGDEQGEQAVRAHRGRSRK